MSETFDKLKAILAEKKALTKEEIDSMTAAHGALTADEQVWIESERHRLERADDSSVTMEQYLEALKVLDSVPEGSPEFLKAEALVNKYESGN